LCKYRLHKLQSSSGCQNSLRYWQTGILRKVVVDVSQQDRSSSGSTLKLVKVRNNTLSVSLREMLPFGNSGVKTKRLGRVRKDRSRKSMSNLLDKNLMSSVILSSERGKITRNGERVILEKFLDN